VPYKEPTWADVRTQLGKIRTSTLPAFADAFSHGKDAVVNSYKTKLASFKTSLAGDSSSQDEQIINSMGARGALATTVADTIRNTTESIITASRVFADKDSSPQEQAGAVLRCFSSFSMMAGLAGPAGLVVGTSISAILGMLTLILDATSPERETEMAKIEKLLRGLEAETEIREIRAAQLKLNQQLKTIETFADGSKTWDGANSILTTSPITHDISQFKLTVAGNWLRNPANQELEKWEEVFVAYAETEIQVIALLTAMLSKLRPEDRPTMLAFTQEFGAQMELLFEELLDTVDECGELWSLTRVYGYGSYVKNPFQPPRTHGGWSDMDIGAVGSIAVSPRSGRVWAFLTYDPTKLITGNGQLITGKGRDAATGAAAEMCELQAGNAPQTCIDIGLHPFAGPDTDLLLVTSTPSHSQPGHLKLNEWVEKRSRFYTKAELERPNSKLGFSQGWWYPKLPTDAIVMARVFRGLPDQSDFDSQNGAVDCVYLVEGHIVTQAALTGLPRQEALSFSYTTLAQVLRRNPDKVVKLPVPLVGELPFRIAVAKRYLYLFTRRQAWRIRHDDLLLKKKEAWRKINMPDGTMGDPDNTDRFNNWHSRLRMGTWWANGLNDMYAWSDDHVVCLIHLNGDLWSGHFNSAERRDWEDYDLEITGTTDVGQIPQGGKRLIVVAMVKDNTYYRVFDPAGRRIVDTDNTQLADRADEIKAVKTALGPEEHSPSAEHKRKLIQAVTELAGPTWTWKPLYGGAARFIKQKHASFDYCRWLHEAGVNLANGAAVST
jgi:hypothetical protein